MAVSVAAALRGSGGLNAGTPLAIASVPVSATEPEAKARMISRMADGLERIRRARAVALGGGVVLAQDDDAERSRSRS